MVGGRAGDVIECCGPYIIFMGAGDGTGLAMILFGGDGEAAGAYPWLTGYPCCFKGGGGGGGGDEEKEEEAAAGGREKPEAGVEAEAEAEAEVGAGAGTGTGTGGGGGGALAGTAGDATGLRR